MRIAGFFLVALIAFAVRAEQVEVYQEGGGPMVLEERIIDALATGVDSKSNDKSAEQATQSERSQDEPANVESRDVAREVEDLRPEVPHGFGPSDNVVEKPVEPPNAQPIVDEKAASANTKDAKAPQQTRTPDEQVAPIKQTKLVDAKAAAPQTANAKPSISDQPAIVQPDKRAKLVVMNGGQKEEPFPPPLPQAHLLKQDASGPSKRAEAGSRSDDNAGDTIFIAVTAVCSAAAVFGLVGAGVVGFRLHKQYKAAQEAEYPHYGITGPVKERTSGNTSPTAAIDAKLAGQAQLYHYQHTKQQIIAMEQSTNEGKGQESDDSEAEGDEGDFSVYECPGLAPTGDIEISNPLFADNATPTKPDTHRTNP